MTFEDKDENLEWVNHKRHLNKSDYIPFVTYDGRLVFLPGYGIHSNLSQFLHDFRLHI